MFDKRVAHRIAGKYTLQFMVTFKYDDDQVNFAPSFPYSYEDIQADSLIWMLSAKKQKD